MIGDDARVNKDLRLIERYVKDTLFFRVIDVYKDENLKSDGILHKDFMTNGKTVVAGKSIHEALDQQWKDYMTYLWTKMRMNKSYKVWLAMKRSNTYQAVQDKFMRECDRE